MPHAFGHIPANDSNSVIGNSLQTGSDLEFMTQTVQVNQAQQNKAAAAAKTAGEKAEQQAKQLQAQSLSSSNRALAEAKAGVSNLNSVRLFNLGL